MYFINLQEYLNAILKIAADINKKKQVKLTHLKLQKILYVVYAFYLIYRDKRILKTNFQAWRYGPVIYEVWQMYKEFGKNSIPHIQYDDLNQIKTDLSKEFNDLYYLIDYLLNIDVWELVEICHIESPWKNIYIPMKNVAIDDAWIIKDHLEYKHLFFEEINAYINKNL